MLDAGSVRERLRQAFKLALALLLSDEEPDDMSLDIQGNQNRAWLGGGLHLRGDIGGVAKHLACRFHDNGPAFDPDPRKQIRGPFAAVLDVDLRESALDCDRCPHRTLGIVLLCLAVAKIGDDFEPAGDTDRTAVVGERLGGN